MKIQRFKDFINENDEPSAGSLNEILQQIADGLNGRFSTYVDSNTGTLYVSQDWPVDDLEFNGEEPRVYAEYSVAFKLAFQDDEAEKASPEVVRLWKLGLAPISELIKGFTHSWSFSVESKDVPELSIEDSNGYFEFISIEDLTGGTLNDLDDIDQFCSELEETINNWADEQGYMLHQQVQEELDTIAGQWDEEDDDEDENDDDDSDYEE